MEQEHIKRKSNIIKFAASCSDFVTLSDVFAMPYQYREILYKIVDERNKALNKMK